MLNFINEYSTLRVIIERVQYTKSFAVISLNMGFSSHIGALREELHTRAMEPVVFQVAVRA